MLWISGLDITTRIFKRFSFATLSDKERVQKLSNVFPNESQITSLRYFNLFCRAFAFYDRNISCASTTRNSYSPIVTRQATKKSPNSETSIFSKLTICIFSCYQEADKLRFSSRILAYNLFMESILIKQWIKLSHCRKTFGQ